MLKQQTGRSPSVGKAILSGTSTGAATSFLGAAVLAKLLDSEVMKMENVGYGILMIHLLAVFLGVKETLRRAGKAGIWAAAATGASYFLLLLAVNALFFQGEFTGMGVTLLLIAAATAGAVLTEGKRSGKRGRRHYKIPK